MRANQQNVFLNVVGLSFIVMIAIILISLDVRERFGKPAPPPKDAVDYFLKTAKGNLGVYWRGRTLAENSGVLWMGFGSDVSVQGPVLKAIVEIVRSKDVLVVAKQSDTPHDNRQLRTNALIIMPCIGTEVSSSPENIAVPQSDLFFKQYLFTLSEFSGVDIPWANRLPKLVWRGAQNYTVNTTRKDVVHALQVPGADAKFIQYSYQSVLDPRHKGDAMTVADMIKHRAILVVDGHGPASNLTWAFASGCTVFLATRYKWWFSDQVQPWTHYIPLAVDGSDAADKVDWFFKNEAQAEQMARNALMVARRIMTPEYQWSALSRAIDTSIRMQTK